MNSLEMAKSGAVWGDVWVDIDFAPFPEEGWNDMAIAFMAELLEVACSFQQSSDTQRRVRFFDGPFWLELSLDCAGNVGITAGGRSEYLSSSIELDRMVLDLKSSAKELVEACNQRGWADQGDVRRLAFLCRCRPLS
ncbi:hypothetical protein [Streptomyces sp. NPDC048611]|uniref:hypothetical protein n=1 Tax=Streptomyces sp. NPDC048611 TaxID=3155635 RepID=UPI003447484D